MEHALRALRLNLKHWAEGHPVAAHILAAVLLVGTGCCFALAFRHGCETKVKAEGFHRRGAENAEKTEKLFGGKEASVGGCGKGVESDEPSKNTRSTAKHPWGPSDESGLRGPPPTGKPKRQNPQQPPIFLNAVAVPLVEGPREAPAGQPAVPPVGPGGRRFWRATIHHTATSANNPAERVRAIDADHRSRGWDGIGYHFLVAEDGTVFSGRPLDRQGAHVRGENEGNLGIALIGNYTDRAPSAAALAAVRRLLAWAFETWGFGSEAVYFHRELAATKCPGPWDKGDFSERTVNDGRRNDAGGDEELAGRGRHGDG